MIGRSLGVALLAMLIMGEANANHAGAGVDAGEDTFRTVVAHHAEGSPIWAANGDADVPREQTALVPTLPSCGTGPVSDACIPVVDCVVDDAGGVGQLEPVSQGIVGPFAPCSLAPPGEPVAVPQVTPDVVLRALRRIDLPAPSIVVQPPGGRTLVNFDTLFRTDAGPLTRTVRLLGRRVDLEIWPASFTWHHGDGTTQTTTEPGRAYESGVPMSAYVSHRYEDAGVTVRPSVETTYAARFRVDGGAWQDVAGTVTRPGPSAALRVVEGRPTLVGAD